jgi:hypothetical protein
MCGNVSAPSIDTSAMDVSRSAASRNCNYHLIGVIFNDVDYRKASYSYDQYKYHYHGKYYDSESGEGTRFSDG